MNQTLEEKKALLRKAMDEGLEVNAYDLDAEAWSERDFQVLYLAPSAVVLESRGIDDFWGYENHEFRIVEPRIGAEDFVQAIERADSRFEYYEYETCFKFFKELKELAAKYREQEANDE